VGLNPRIPNLKVKHMAKVTTKTVNLALQGGGAHGAFAWGVKPPARPASYDKKVALVLQGGGALGSYQAGVYEALASSEYLPDWMAGISIGAINAAIIAGNAPENRVARLRSFWEEITAPTAWWPSGLSGPLTVWQQKASTAPMRSSARWSGWSISTASTTPRRCASAWGR
jgi:predicted acylesterase/phospholipase RssA